MSQNCLETSGILSLKCPTYFIISCKNSGLASFSCHAHHHALLVNSIYMSVYIVSSVFNPNDGNRRGHVNQTYLFLIFCDGWLWAQLIPIKQFPQRKWNDSLSHRNDIKNVFPFHYSSFIFWSQMLFRTRGVKQTTVEWSSASFISDILYDIYNMPFCSYLQQIIYFDQRVPLKSSACLVFFFKVFFCVES